MSMPVTSIHCRLLGLIMCILLMDAVALACERCGTTACFSVNEHAQHGLPSGQEKTKKKRLRVRGGLNTKHDVHYFFGPSAIPMEAGTGYYQNQDVVLHSAYFSPRNGISFGGGVQLASLFSSLATRERGPMFHLRVNGGGQVTEGVHVGGFAMGLRIGGSYEISDGVKTPSTLGLFGGQVTAGKERFNITVSGGIGVDDHGKGDDPLWGVAGLYHISPRCAIITESWSIPIRSYNYRMFTYGARFKHRKMAFDGGFAYNNDLNNIFFLGAPVVGFSLML